MSQMQAFKACTLCKEVKPYSEYTLDKKSGRPTTGRCRPCHAKAEAARRQRRPSKPPRTCLECSSSLASRGPQALVCEACARRRATRRDSAPLPTRRDVRPVLPLIREGRSVEEACILAGVSWLTLHRRKQSDPQLAADLAAAVEESRRIRLSPCGTQGAYVRGCRCDLCRGFIAQSSAKSRTRWRSEAARGTDVPHGLTGRLNYGCKCSVCRAASREAGAKWQRAANRETLDRVTRHNQQWTGPEMELAARKDLSAREVAEMIGRTMWAVRTMRRRLAKEPSQQWLAGQRSNLHSGA